MAGIPKRAESCPGGGSEAVPANVPLAMFGPSAVDLEAGVASGAVTSPGSPCASRSSVARWVSVLVAIAWGAVQPVSTSVADDSAPVVGVGSQVTCVIGTEPVCVGRETIQVPARSAMLTDAVMVDFGLRHGCMLGRDGRASCWGEALHGQLGVPADEIEGRHLGRPARTDIEPVPGDAVLTRLAAGWLHTCGITVERQVLCWGDNTFGQLGRPGSKPGAGPVAGLDDVRGLSAGGYHTCAVDGQGGVWCWGDGAAGQLGSGEPRDVSAPVKVKGLSGAATAVAAGAYHACALVSDGSAACWGHNRLGQVGDGTGKRRFRASRVEGLREPARSLAAGASFSCAVLGSGRVQCWGSNAFGEQGSSDPPAGHDSAAVARQADKAVTGLPGPVRSLDAAGTHACATLEAGNVFCWGGNDSGQLGDGTLVIRTVPVPWKGLQGTAGPLPPVDPTPPFQAIDVSDHSGRVDWAEARRNGFRIGFTRATMGVDFRDPYFPAHWERMRQAGLMRGAYHYFVGADDPVRQARHFLGHVVLEPGDLLPVVDIESAAGETPADLAAKLKAYSDEIEAVVGVKPIIYTSPGFWNDHVGGDGFAGHPLWVAHYDVDRPAIPIGWTQWQIWQWKANAQLERIAPMVDLNRVHADIDLQSLAIPAVAATVSR